MSLRDGMKILPQARKPSKLARKQITLYESRLFYFWPSELWDVIVVDRDAVSQRVGAGALTRRSSGMQENFGLKPVGKTTSEQFAESVGKQDVFLAAKGYQKFMARKRKQRRSLAGSSANAFPSGTLPGTRKAT